ncbi:hypothetical protein [Kribbella turkmenica]|uniref:hypothetical protein n=1 Tax=Kribbella turkmenica TaxID=2530375 RepID=UPI00104ADD37|nr:hypothetical protein [Kribbella turkmenica]
MTLSIRSARPSFECHSIRGVLVEAFTVTSIPRMTTSVSNASAGIGGVAAAVEGDLDLFWAADVEIVATSASKKPRRAAAG